MVSSCPHNLHYTTVMLCSLLAPISLNLYYRIKQAIKPHLARLCWDDASYSSDRSKCRVSTFFVTREPVKQVTWVCCPVACALAPRQTTHMVKFDIPGIAKWDKLLHCFRCPTNILKLKPVWVPLKTKTQFSATCAHSPEQAQQGQNEGATWSILSAWHTWPRQATPQLVTILAPAVCCSTAEPLPWAITTWPQWWDVSILKARDRQTPINGWKH